MSTSPSYVGNFMNMGIPSESTPSMHQHNQQQRKHNNMVSPRCNKKIPTRNSFDALNNLVDTEEVEKPTKIWYQEKKPLRIIKSLSQY
jgi:hypothetical protein